MDREHNLHSAQPSASCLAGALVYIMLEQIGSELHLINALSGFVVIIDETSSNKIQLELASV